MTDKEQEDSETVQVVVEEVPKALTSPDAKKEEPDVVSHKSSLTTKEQDLWKCLVGMEQEEVWKWENTIKNERIYSSKYIPVPRESRAIQELASSLSVSLPNDTEEKKSNDNKSDGDHLKNDISHLLSTSIILKRECVLSRRITMESNADDYCLQELILLSHGFIVTSNTTSAIPSSKKRDQSTNKGFGLVKHKFGNALNTLRFKRKESNTFSAALENVVHVRDPYPYSHTTSSTTVGNDTDDNTTEEDIDTDTDYYNFSISSQNTTEEVEYEFICASKERKDAWLSALQTSIIQNMKRKQGNERTLGWQHQIMHTSLHSCVLRNNLGEVIEILSAVCRDKGYYQQFPETKVDFNLNEIDSYNGYPALHYAILNHVNPEIIKSLLEYGADPDFSAGDKSTPLGCAQTCKNEEATKLLHEYGAEKVERGRPKKVKDTDSGSTKDSTEKKKGIASDFMSAMDRIKHDATKAMKPMSENMSLLVERGQKLDSMDNKSSALKDSTQAYRDNMRKLREQMEKKNKNIFGL